MEENQQTHMTPSQPLDWETTTYNPDTLRTWRNTAFNAAKDKYHHNHDNIETILQTGEAFGRAVYDAHLQRTHDWDLDDLCTEINTLFLPLGDSFEITGGHHDMALTFLRRHTLVHNHQDWPLDTLFTYGTLRGLFLSAFPHGELIVQSEMLNDHHPSSLMFKLHPSSLDRLTRERVKEAYSIMNRHEQP